MTKTLELHVAGPAAPIRAGRSRTRRTQAALMFVAVSGLALGGCAIDDGMVDDGDVDDLEEIESTVQLLRNRGFEDGLTYWTRVGTVTRTTYQPNGGTYSARMAPVAPALEGKLRQCVPARAGTRYTASGYVRWRSGGKGASLLLAFYNSSNDEIDFDGLDLVPESHWTRHSFSLTAPARTVKACLSAGIAPGRIQDWDSMSLTRWID